MSANVNVTRPGQARRVLLLAANAGVSPTTGWPIGFWWSELTHPYWTFTEAEFAVRAGRLITGQQQYSGGAAARLVIEALGR